MTDKQFNKFDKHYKKLVERGTIKNMNDAYIYKLAIEKAIKVIPCCKSDSELLPTKEEAIEEINLRFDKGTKSEEDIKYGWIECYEWFMQEVYMNKLIK